MSSLAYVPIYCTSCGKQWKLPTEKAEQLHTLKCQRVIEGKMCDGRLKRTPEPGEPLWPGQGFWPMSPDVEWMA
jgi:hypothetical protein